MISQIQQQYPLAVGKKYFKKVLTRSFGIIFFAFILAMITGSLADLASANYSFNFSWFFIVLLGIYLVFFIPYSIYIRAYINNYFYDLNDNFITIKKGVIAPSEIHVQYFKIQDVYVDQDIWDRILGIYDVHIASATVSSGVEAHIDGVDQTAAEGLKNLLLEKIKNPTASVPPSSPTSIPSISPAPAVPDGANSLSSGTYPIQSRWFYSRLISGLISYLLIAVLASFYFYSADLKLTGDVPGSYQVWISAIALIWLVLVVLHILYLVVWRRNYYFEFAPQYILLKTGFVAKQEKHLPYTAIQNVTARQGLIDRMFGLVNVVIENAASVAIGKGRTMADSIIIPGQNRESTDRLMSEINKIMSTLPKRSQTGL